jgi:hypothetical protein
MMPTLILTVLETFSQPGLILDRKKQIAAANAASYKMFSLAEAATRNQSLIELETGTWNLPPLRAAEYA